MTYMYVLHAVFVVDGPCSPFTREKSLVSLVQLFTFVYTYCSLAKREPMGDEPYIRFIQGVGWLTFKVSILSRVHNK